MSINIMIPWNERLRNRSLPLRPRTRVAIVTARLLVFLPPDRLRRVLGFVRRGSRPATVAEAELAMSSVLSSSLGLNAYRACLPRSIAAALLCRLHGTWATWCTGVVLTPPFTTHAWIEMNDQLVRENVGTHQLGRLMVISPVNNLDC